MRRLAQALLATSGALILVAGVTVALLGTDRRKPRASREKRKNHDSGLQGPTEKPRRTDYFEIRRTQSELGYTYWILKGHGAYQCFELFDSWPEAMAEARFRTDQVSSLQYR